ncbi:hypothetical protein [Pseudoalteromonas sp. OOF1S-7]|uniref:hypothetical protein n=1 Tax=Pseudoalteromonas sp. OOF1S-7 TaxID=2917757 RepID=UPI001EF72309|nr:hypothetical protein [Pseudoalteromonas sp. OOF1S-7]MCG7537050.1 hypothetical protein [Pseudoalteromonas sp. OOF1S-7]
MKRLLSLLVLICVVSGCASTNKATFLETSATIYEANRKLEYLFKNPNEDVLLAMIDRHASEAYVKNELGMADPKFAMKSAYVSIGAIIGLASFEHIVYSHSREVGDYWLSRYIFSHNNGTFALVDITLTKQGYKLVDVNNLSYRSSLVRFFAEYDQQVKSAGHEEVISAVTDHLEKKESQLALEKYHQLPAEIKTLPIVHETLFRSVETCEGEQHQIFCETLLKESEEADHGLLKANLYRSMAQYEQALTKFEQLSDDVRSSPPILMEKAMVHAHLGHKREAFGIALDALYRNAGGAYGYLIMLQVALITDEHDYTIELLTFMKETFDIQFSEQELSDISNSENFMNSQQYALFKDVYLS